MLHLILNTINYRLTAGICSHWHDDRTLSPACSNCWENIFAPKSNFLSNVTMTVWDCRKRNKIRYFYRTLLDTISIIFDEFSLISFLTSIARSIPFHHDRSFFGEKNQLFSAAGTPRCSRWENSVWLFSVESNSNQTNLPFLWKFSNTPILVVNKNGAKQFSDMKRMIGSFEYDMTGGASCVYTCPKLMKIFIVVRWYHGCEVF